MTAWILLSILWVALFSLILHDATRNDPGGSAVLNARKACAAILGRAAQKLRAALRNSAASSSPIRQNARAAVEKAPIPSTTMAWWRKDDRISIAADELQLAIAQAVKAEPGCEDFIGVFVEPKIPKSRLDPNWELRGVKFGNADRKAANEPLATVVARFQQEFRIIVHHRGQPQDSGQVRALRH
jgi:hypothetical protein